MFCKHFGVTEYYAWQNGYSVFTNDLDFSAILVSTRASGPSVIQIRAEDTRPEAHIDRIADIFVKSSATLRAPVSW